MTDPLEPLFNSDASVPPRRVSPFAAIALVLALTAAAGLLYWRYFYYPRTPQYAVRQFLQYCRSGDYAGAYRNMTLPEFLVKQVGITEKGFTNMARLAGGVIPNLADFRIGPAAIREDEATVQVQVTLAARTSDWKRVEKLEVPLVQEDGRWKVDGIWATNELLYRGGRQILQKLLGGKS